MKNLLKKNLYHQIKKLAYVNGIPFEEFKKEFDTYKITCDFESKGE